MDDPIHTHTNFNEVILKSGRDGRIYTCKYARFPGSRVGAKPILANFLCSLIDLGRGKNLDLVIPCRWMKSNIRGFFLHTAPVYVPDVHVCTRVPRHPLQDSKVLDCWLQVELCVHMILRTINLDMARRSYENLLVDPSSNLPGLTLNAVY